MVPFYCPANGHYWFSCASGRPFESDRPVEAGVHLSRGARRVVRGTGAVKKHMPKMSDAADSAIVKLWDSLHAQG